MLDITGLTRQYGAFAAVDSLSLRVKEGEVFGLLGHNGAGKTTTVLMLTTLLRPTSGRGSIDGLDIVKDNLAVRRRIGYLPENVNLYGDLSVEENLRFFGSLSGVADVSRAVSETLALLDFSKWKASRVRELSKGMRQRVGIAQAILHRPKLLFLDEPASGLDPQGTKDIRDILQMLNKTYGTTIFMNTHLLSEVTKTCTSIGILNHGKLLVSGSIDAVLGQFPSGTSLEDVYLALNEGGGPK